MNKIFFQMPCLSESKIIKSEEIYEVLFDKKVDKRYPESAIQKFLLLNEKMLSFLGIEVKINGSGRDLSIQFISSNNIGAIPIKMPYDGIARKDFYVKPKFKNESDPFSDLTQLLSKLEYTILPEYADGEQLISPIQLRPPMYYEAVKYIDLFEKAFEYKWFKFNVVSRIHHYPKSNTNWEKYSISSSNPENIFKYESRDSLLTINHVEWQELTYIFNLAKNIIIQSRVPSSIRHKYTKKINSILKRNSVVPSKKVEIIPLRSTDPYCIQKVKKQANIILQKGSTTCVAWRIDMAQLFERYVQHVVLKSVKELSGTLFVNKKIYGKGFFPSWGLRYLEPDMIIKLGEHIYMADAKYKAHYYAITQRADVLKETHREDLHQLLAYCSFSPEKNKVGILFYPANDDDYRKINYREQAGGVNNTLVFYGIPFELSTIESSISKIKKLFLQI